MYSINERNGAQIHQRHHHKLPRPFWRSTTYLAKDSDESVGSMNEAIL